MCMRMFTLDTKDTKKLKETFILTCSLRHQILSTASIILKLAILVGLELGLGLL